MPNWYLKHDNFVYLLFDIFLNIFDDFFLKTKTNVEVACSGEQAILAELLDSF